jgi:hypothetical protein
MNSHNHTSPKAYRGHRGHCRCRCGWGLSYWRRTGRHDRHRWCG